MFSSRRTSLVSGLPFFIIYQLVIANLTPCNNIIQHTTEELEPDWHSPTDSEAKRFGYTLDYYFNDAVFIK